MIQESLLPILEMFFKQHVPILQATFDALEKFVHDKSPYDLSQELPRSLGLIDFTVVGFSGTRIAMSFDVWKTQRVVDLVNEECDCFLSQFNSSLKALTAPRVINTQ